MTIKAIRIHENGGPEVLRWEDHDMPPPAAGRSPRSSHRDRGQLFRHQRAPGGFYIARPLRFPVILGNEAAGVVARSGRPSPASQPGDRVAYAGMRGEFFEETGAYAQERNVPAERLVKLPDGVSDRQAAGMMVKGLTASLIVNHVYRPKPGRHHPGPRGGERRRADPHAVGEASRRDRDRHRRLDREG